MSQKSYNSQATLYLVPTPIGNMEDITLRAINVLKSVEVIFSEDTRVTSQLLKHLNINKKLIASHEHNEEQNKEKLISYLADGKSVALVTDRGTPIISDPGYILAKTAILEGYSVVGLPGATALIPALIVSGLSPKPFLFYGFLNSKASKQKEELEQLATYPFTFILYEAPHRIEKTLENMLKILGDRQISISREISKRFEEIYRGNISQVLTEIKGAKGEMVIVVDGNHAKKSFDDLNIFDHVNMYINEGIEKMEAMKIVAKERKISKSIVYKKYEEESKGDRK